MKVNRFSSTETGAGYMYHLTKNKKTHQSANLIFDALCTLMMKKDFSEITIKELVEQAGVGRATFYRLFDSLKDVLHYKCDVRFNELRESLKNYRVSESLSGPIGSTLLLEPMLRFWYLDSIIIEIIIKANTIDVLHINLEALFEDLYDRLEDESSKKKNKDYFIALRTGILFNLLITWIKNKKNIPPDDLADIILEQISEVRI